MIRINGWGEWGEPIPPLVNTFHGSLVILGGAACVWDDLLLFNNTLGLQLRPDYMAVNDIGQYWQNPLAHWVTLHPEYMPGWMRFRLGHYYGDGRKPIVHSARPDPGVDVHWDVPTSGGTSGLFGCLVALALGYEKIILVGMPMDNSHHFFDPPWQSNASFEDNPNKLEWIGAKDRIFKDKVRSMSGRTRQWLGVPTEDWLNDRKRKV